MRAAPIAEHALMGSLLVLICFFGAAFGVRLEMFESDGVATALVTSQVNAESGRNVSLFCRLADEGDRYFDTPVVWGRKGKGFRFNEEIILSTNLSFAPIRIVNQGIYFCASLRYALHKTVYVAVREAEHPKKRLKRQQTVGGTRDLNQLLKKKVVLYGTSSNAGQESLSQKFKEYARVVGPLVVVTLIVSTVLYCLMKTFNKIATRDRMAKEQACKHPCSCPCELKKGSLGAGINNPNYIRSDGPDPAKPNAKIDDDTFIFLPFLFEAT